LQSVRLKKIGYLFSNFSTFQPFFEDFQPFVIRGQLITWIVIRKFATTEWTSVSNLNFLWFSLPCYLLLLYWPWRYIHFFAGTLQWK